MQPIELHYGWRRQARLGGAHRITDPLGVGAEIESDIGLEGPLGICWQRPGFIAPAIGRNAGIFQQLGVAPELEPHRLALGIAEYLAEQPRILGHCALHRLAAGEHHLAAGVGDGQLQPEFTEIGHPGGQGVACACVGDPHHQLLPIGSLFDAGRKGSTGSQERQALLLERRTPQPHQLVLGAGKVVAIEARLHCAVFGGLARHRGAAVARLRVHVAVDAAAPLGGILRLGEAGVLPLIPGVDDVGAAARSKLVVA
ncbi:hypothetical protein D3C80_893270 [compost metagenome]